MGIPVFCQGAPTEEGPVRAVQTGQCPAWENRNTFWIETEASRSP